MTDREKLVELLDNSFEKQYGKRGLLTAHHTAEDLIANGVIVLPCKVGDWVWRLSTKHISKVKYIESTKISRIAVDANAVWLFCECNPISRCTFGKTVFLTREDAEAALKEGQ